MRGANDDNAYLLGALQSTNVFAQATYSLSRVDITIASYGKAAILCVLKDDCGPIVACNVYNYPAKTVLSGRLAGHQCFCSNDYRLCISMITRPPFPLGSLHTSMINSRTQCLVFWMPRFRGGGENDTHAHRWAWSKTLQQAKSYGALQGAHRYKAINNFFFFPAPCNIARRRTVAWRLARCSKHIQTRTHTHTHTHPWLLFQLLFNLKTL